MIIPYFSALDLVEFVRLSDGPMCGRAYPPGAYMRVKKIQVSNKNVGLLIKKFSPTLGLNFHQNVWLYGDRHATTKPPLVIISEDDFFSLRSFKLENDRAFENVNFQASKKVFGILFKSIGGFSRNTLL